MYKIYKMYDTPLPLTGSYPSVARALRWIAAQLLHVSIVIQRKTPATTHTANE